MDSSAIDRSHRRVGLSRRALLRGSLRLALAGLGVSLLAACKSPGPAAAPTASVPTAPGAGATPVSAGFAYPKRTPVQAPPADMPSGNPDVPDGYFAYPKQPFKAVQETPGRGGDVTVMTEIFQPVPAPLESNPAWQQMNKLLNANMVMTIVPFADYAAKFATTVAGGDIPEIVFVPMPYIPQLPDFLKAQCEDLTPFLGGDNIREYPNLSNITSPAWRGAVFDRAIWGIPINLPIFFWVLWVHQDMVDPLGGQMPKDGEDFKRILKAVTKPEQGQYGLASQAGYNYAWDVTNGLWPSLFDAPNGWKQDNGAFTRDWETEEYKAAVGFARDVYAMGVYDPNSPTYNVLSARSAFQQRRCAFRFDGVTSVTFTSGARLNPPSILHLVAPFAAQSGGKPSYFFGPGYFGFTTLRKNADKDRIKELLRILNYIAAPFGSEEYLNVRFGVKGADYDINPRGNPILTEKGNADAMPWGAPSGAAVASPPNVLFDPSSEEFPKVIQPAELEMHMVGKANPAVGLWSPTDAQKGTVLWQKVGDGISDIVTGRRPIGDFDQLVKEWREGGGDQIRSEYEKDFAASKA